MGSDDDGYSVRLKFKHFLRYLKDPAHAPADDSPLYIFDGTFADRTGSKGLRGDYEVPALWQEDLFHHVGERRRPPYRCLIFRDSSPTLFTPLPSLSRIWSIVAQDCRGLWPSQQCWGWQKPWQSMVNPIEVPSRMRGMMASNARFVCDR